MRLKITFTVLFLMSICALPVMATDYYVATDGSDDDNGLSEGSAWQTITHAVDWISSNAPGTSGNPATINVAAGTYDRDHEGDFPIQVSSDAGHLIVRGAGSSETIMDGLGAEAWEEYWAFLVDDAERFEVHDMRFTGMRGGIQIVSLDGDATFQNLVLEDFENYSWGVALQAFRIQEVSGDIVFENVAVSGTQSEDHGPGIYIHDVDGAVTVTGSQFTSTRAENGHGGAIYAYNLGSTFTVEHTNFAQTYSAQKGGAVFLDDVSDDISFNNVTFESPYAHWSHGGSVYLYEADNDVTFNEVILNDSYANDDGGGIYLYKVDGDVEITDFVADSPNARYNHGGAIYLKQIDGSLTIDNVTATDSRADDHGGVIYAYDVDGTVDISNVIATSPTAVYGNGGTIYLVSTGSTATLSNITVTDSWAEGGDGGGTLYITNIGGLTSLDNINTDNSYVEWGRGGGFYFKDLYYSLEMNDVTISNARSWDGGGGIYMTRVNGDITATNVTIDSCNTIYNGGGGILINSMPRGAHDDLLRFDGLAMCRNVAWDHGGGGVCMLLNGFQGNVEFNNFTFMENAIGPWGHGGGLYFDKYETVTLTNGTFYGNRTGEGECYEQYHGGGMYANYGEHLIIDNVVFWGNEAQGNGGGLASNKNNGHTQITNVVFLDNLATRADEWNYGDGGGAWLYLNSAGWSDNYIWNVLFAGNEAERNGGGLYVKKAALDLVNATVAGNIAGQDAPSIYVHNQASLDVYNSIVWGNGERDDGTLTTYRGAIDWEYSLVENEEEEPVNGDGNLYADPLFIDAGAGNYGVIPGSYTFDAGMPYDDGERYSDYSHEPDPNEERINMGFWGPITGAGLDCEDCGGFPVSIPGGDSEGSPMAGFGGTGGGGSVESIKIVLRDQYIFIGTPVLPDTVEFQHIPFFSLGDDVNSTMPSYPNQTWRFSRWTNALDYPGGTFRGYVRYLEDEPGIGQDIGDPPSITPGLGYFFVWNFGSVPIVDSINIDIHRYMREAEPLVYEMEPWPGAESGLPYGLNMMANPWPFPIDWQDIRFSLDQETWLSPTEAADEEVGWVNAFGTIWNHRNEYYMPMNGRIDPWEGFWVTVYTEEPIYIQFNPRRVDDSRAVLGLDELDETFDWTLMITARRVDELQVDPYNMIGVGDESSDDLDELDAIEIAPLAHEAVYMRTRLVSETGSLHDFLTFDFRENNLEEVGYKAWLQELRFAKDDGAAYPVDVRLQWPTVHRVPENVNLSLYSFSDTPFNPENETLLVENLRDTPEYVINVATSYGSATKREFFWVVASVDGGLEQTDVEEEVVELPLTTELASINPNPFNSTTTVRFNLSEAQDVSVKVFNLLGQQVATLANQYYAPGQYTVSWQAQDIASGVYFVQFTAGQTVQSRKILLIR